MTAPDSALRAARPAALAFIFITVLIDVLAFGVVIPVLPHLIEGFVGGDTAHAARWVGVFGTVFAAVQFVSAPVQGALSDRYGRRPVILLSCLGLGLDFVFMALANSLPWLLVGRVISAVTSASFTTANAYIADVTSPDKRAQSFGLIGAAFGLGFIIGPALGGWLGAIDLRWPFWAAAILALVNFAYGLFVLPESLPPERRTTRLVWREANPLGALALLRRYPQVLGLAGVVLLINFAHYVYPSVFVLFADYRYGWGPQSVGSVLAVVGVMSVLVQAVLVKRAVGRFGERRTLLVGLGAGALGSIAYAIAPTGAWFIAAIPVTALWGMATPTTQALITRQIDPAEQGRIQGALSSLVSLAGIAGPTVFTSVFAWFIAPSAPVHAPGAPFALAGACLLAAWLVARRHAPQRAPVLQPQPDAA
ncbi:TCR/Tet family MFS transporter [Lysobacter korlensis]|uniref:TCR/Tet family MFS transporter n=1 Tax=Lysobacter korlensis TaxID=553636 RepID=A0ABV6RHD5_9GAMM